MNLRLPSWPVNCTDASGNQIPPALGWEAGGPAPGRSAALLRPLRRRLPARPDRLPRRRLEHEGPRRLHRLGPAHPPVRLAPCRQRFPLLNPPLGPRPSAPLPHARPPRPPTGSRATPSAPSCPRPSAKPLASTAPANAPPTGSMSAKPKAAASLTAPLQFSLPCGRDSSAQAGSTRIPSASSCPPACCWPTRRSEDSLAGTPTRDCRKVSERRCQAGGADVIHGVPAEMPLTPYASQIICGVWLGKSDSIRPPTRNSNALPTEVQDELLARAKLLEAFGPVLGRPRVDNLNGSRHANMKELRFTAAGGLASRVGL